MSKMKRGKRRYFTKEDQVRLGQANKGLRKAIDRINVLRKDRMWMVEEIRRLRAILAEHNIEYEQRVLRTPEEIEDGNDRFSD